LLAGLDVLACNAHCQMMDGEHIHTMYTNKLQNNRSGMLSCCESKMEVGTLTSSQQHCAFGMDNHCFSMHPTWQDLEEIGEACL